MKYPFLAMVLLVSFPFIGHGSSFAQSSMEIPSSGPPSIGILATALENQIHFDQLPLSPDATITPVEAETLRSEVGFPFYSMAQPIQLTQVKLNGSDSEPLSFEEPVDTIRDPLEPMNRIFFAFNDKFYFWFFKPIARGYKMILPEDLRIGIRNFFSNLKTPVRVGNCLLQARFKCSGNETFRFILNSTFGMAGFIDVAKQGGKLEKEDADFGQTLGKWGLGPGFYIDWFILGPSSLRDTFGFIGDIAMDPRTYITGEPILYVFTPVEHLNETSLRMGEYEDLKKAALDPYVALRDAYHQYRQKKIKAH